MALNDVPQAGQTLGATRAPIQNNFAVIDTAFAVDHVDYNLPNQGEHNQVSLPVQNPAPGFSAGTLGIYNFLNPTTAKNELYVHKITGATTIEIPMTASILSSNSAPTPTTPTLWTYLPSGIYLTWGSANTPGGGLGTVTLNSPPPNAILSVQLTPSSNTTTYTNQTIRFVDILSNSQFRVFGSVNGAGGACGFTFLVIGY